MQVSGLIWIGLKTAFVDVVMAFFLRKLDSTAAAEGGRERLVGRERASDGAVLATLDDHEFSPVRVVGLWIVEPPMRGAGARLVTGERRGRHDLGVHAHALGF